MTRTRKWLWLWLSLLACTLCAACRKAPVAKPLKASSTATTPTKPAELPKTSTETSDPQISLFAAVSDTSDVELGDFATPTDTQPSGFVDSAWLLDRAGAWLRARLGGGKSLPTTWQRRDRLGWQTDVIAWQPEGFSLRTQGDDTTFLATESGCEVRAGAFKARCEPEMLGPAAALGALTGLAWPEAPGRGSWSVEALRVSSPQSIYMRLVQTRLHVRVNLEMSADGSVKWLSIPVARATLRPDADGLAYERTDRPVVWHWTVQPAGGTEAFARKMLRLDNAAGVDLTVEAWELAAKPRGLTALGPFSVEVDQREDGLRARALQAPVMAEGEEAPWKGVQVASVKQLPVEAVLECKRADVTKALKASVKQGCHVVQLLGASLNEPEAVDGAKRREGLIVLAVRGCP